MNFNNKLPEWKNSGTEPSDSLKNDGFKAGYKPSANVFNWFWSLVSKCITEIQSKLSNEETARTEADKNLQQPTFTEASTRGRAYLRRSGSRRDGNCNQLRKRETKGYGKS